MSKDSVAHLFSTMKLYDECDYFATRLDLNRFKVLRHRQCNIKSGTIVDWDEHKELLEQSVMPIVIHDYHLLNLKVRKGE